MGLIPAALTHLNYFGPVKMLRLLAFATSNYTIFVSLDCEMFRSCLFFYDLSTANVKEKREPFNRMVIRSWYDYVAMAPFVSARWRKSSACTLLYGFCSSLPTAEMYLPRPGPAPDIAVGDIVYTS
jgi:hypothetical protein